MRAKLEKERDALLARTEFRVNGVIRLGRLREIKRALRTLPPSPAPKKRPKPEPKPADAK